MSGSGASAAASTGWRRLSERLIPDPFLLAVMLTGVVAVMAASRGISPAPDGSERSLVAVWFAGLAQPSGLAFALQMCLILVSGHALAASPGASTWVSRLARWPGSSGQAVVLVAVFSALAGWIHWGLGAVAGAMLAREVARVAVREGREVHYPMLGAAAYVGMAIWHVGLSGSAPLTVAQSEHFTHHVVGTVPLSATLFPVTHVVFLLVVISALVAACWWLGRVPWGAVPEAVLLDTESTPAQGGGARETSLWARLECAPWMGRLLGGAMALLVVVGIVRGDLSFDLNAVNWFFLATGLAAHGSLRSWLESLAEGARGAAAILVQFPLYFGILGLLTASGWIAVISETMTAWSTPLTFPLLAFLGAGAVNFMVPSGGGQWAVQGEVLLSAGAAHGVAPELTILAFAYGDGWTNLLQPFWALPLLGIMRLRASELIAGTSVLFVVMGGVVCIGLLVLGMR